VVVGPADFFLPCLDWRLRRCRGHAIRMARDYCEGWYKTLIFIVVAPIMGLVLGFTFMVAVYWLLQNKAPRRIDAWFRKLQLLSAAAYSWATAATTRRKPWHRGFRSVWSALFECVGTGRQLGEISLAHYSGGSFVDRPGDIFWRLADCSYHGSRITKLRPVGGFCAEAAGAITLFSTALAGIPVSTTHTITGAIVGVGAVNRLSAVRWGVARRIVWAWILTIPAAGAGRSGCVLAGAIASPRRVAFRVRNFIGQKLRSH